MCNFLNKNLSYLKNINSINLKLFKYIILLLFIILLILSIYDNKEKKNYSSRCNIKKYNQLYHNYNSEGNKEIKQEKFFFMHKNGKLRHCRNFGILVYNYSFMKRKPKLINIGDYIQSLAALQFLPNNCIPFFVDRDSIEFFNKTKFKIIIIMNSWNIIQKGNRKVPSNIYPIYLSYHINNKNYIDSFSLKNLKKNEPIGCRDIFTLKYLQKQGINSYFSSCLTTTLDINFAVNQTERINDIIFIDFRFGLFPEADKFIKSLKAYNFSNIKYKRHMYKSQYTHLQRFIIAKRLLDQYARAKLVISTRIHGALPCLALKTPIIFINRKYDKRYPGLYELLNTVGINSKGKFEINVKLNNNNLVVNPTNYLEYANRLKIRLKNLFLNKKYLKYLNKR